MKYFSEITNETYDTIADLVKAEKDAKENRDPNMRRVKEAKETLETTAIPLNKMHNAINALWEEYDKKCDEILNADVIKEFVDAFVNYKDILGDFVKEHGKVDDDLSDAVLEALDHACDYEELFDEDFCDCDDDDDCCGTCERAVCDGCEVAEADAAEEDACDIADEMKCVGDGEYYGKGEKDGVKWEMYVKHTPDDGKVPSFHSSFARLLKNILS